jgi:predicted nucleotidyltransferase
MTKVEAITALQRRAEALQALGATSLYLFGSVVRDEAKPASDLFIDCNRDGRFNCFWGSRSA